MKTTRPVHRDTIGYSLAYVVALLFKLAFWSCFLAPVIWFVIHNVIL